MWWTDPWIIHKHYEYSKVLWKVLERYGKFQTIIMHIWLLVSSSGPVLFRSVRVGRVWTRRVVRPRSTGGRRNRHGGCGSWRGSARVASRCSWCRRRGAWSPRGWTGSGSSRRPGASASCRWTAWRASCSGSCWRGTAAARSYRPEPVPRTWSTSWDSWWSSRGTEAWFPVFSYRRPDMWQNTYWHLCLLSPVPVTGYRCPWSSWCVRSGLSYPRYPTVCCRYCTISTETHFEMYSWTCLLCSVYLISKSIKFPLLCVLCVAWWSSASIVSDHQYLY